VKRRLKEDHINIFKYLKGGYKEDGDRLFSVAGGPEVMGTNGKMGGPLRTLRSTFLL